MTTQRSPRYFDGRLLTASDLTSEAPSVHTFQLFDGDQDAPLITGSVPNPG